ncbi:MAG: ATP-binding cassette domain-containing protein [Oligoflexales bacterium]
MFSTVIFPVDWGRMIRFENLSKRYGSKELFQDLSWAVPEGERVAVTGQNGMGKSTLLKIITGEIPADGGSIIMPQQAQLGFLKQDLNPNPKVTVQLECEDGAKRIVKLQEQMDAALQLGEAGMLEWEKAHTIFEQYDGYALPSRASTILSGLGFGQDKLESDPKLLSPGWRLRLELARVLVDQPDVLILDEPTNYLDLPSLIWLENFLLEYTGTVLFVSHDQDLLTRLPTMVANLHFGELEVYRGNYPKFREWIQVQEETKQAARDKMEGQKQHLQGFIDRFGAKASKASQARSMGKKLDKLEQNAQGLQARTNERKAVVKLPQALKSSRILYQVEDGSIGYDSKPVLSNINMVVEKGQKIAVLGANGLGKSTFLKSIFGELPVCSGTFEPTEHTKIRYFSQQLEDLDPEDTVLESLSSLSQQTMTERRKILGAFLFSHDDMEKPVKVLSGGERSRLGLARLIAAPANFLLLDEPTNHLDIQMCDTLAHLLSSWDGTLLFVSHDRSFIRKVATSVFAINTRGEPLYYPGTFEEYCEYAVDTGFDPTFSGASLTAGNKKSPSKSKKQSEGPKKSSGLSQNQRRKLEKKSNELEKKVQKLQSDIADLDMQLAHHYCEDISKKRQQCNADLESSEEEWLTVQSRLES